ncbi:MAG TPA: M3 family metallopeptidase [Opitutaceae bacterium]|nr:M3 family metallopeptidase [Opitutaceae bacterium]
MSTHPFLAPDFAVRWSQLTPASIGPDIQAALAQAQCNLDAIAAQDLAAATFASTVEALECACDDLNRAWGLVGHLNSVADSPALREAYNAMLPAVSEFYARIPLNEKLWAALRAFAATPDALALTGVQKRLFEETMADFRQAGADLPPEKKARLEKLEAELSQLCQKYSENVLDSTNAWELIVDDETKLAGLPVHAKEAARRNALAKGQGSDAQPRWRFTLHMPSLEPFMTYLDAAALRRRMWEGSIGVGAAGAHDNTGLVRQILALRQEKAVLLGKSHFPDQVLARRMARNGATALRFVEDLHGRVREAFARETAELEQFVAERTGRTAGRLAPWETGYWAEKLRQERYAFDEEALRPFFPLEKVIGGLFEICRRAFGAVAVEQPTGAVEVWHPEVKFYELRDEATGRHLGSFYADWHPRESKRGGAWMNYLITGEPDAEGKLSPHLGLICGNLTPPGGDKPALLTHREVETVFHEFGHLLHHLLGEVPYKSLNGVNVAWDFVELPSQIFENWTWEREGLDLFARHFETGATIPYDLFAKMKAARNFRAATVTMRQLSLGKMDLELHLHPERYAAGDLDAAIKATLADYLMPTEPSAPSLVRRFGHLFSGSVGYAAGYYSYKWAEVLDADAFTRFQREGIFNGVTGAEFRRHVLSRGNAEEPMTLFKRFMGREPDLDALLVRAGLV